MGKVIGLVLILAGAGLAWQVLSTGSERAVAPVQQIEVAKTPPPSIDHAAPAPREMARTVERTDQPIVASEPHPAGGANTLSPSMAVIATLVPRASESTAAPTLKPLPKRESLALELQRELRRVGCYEGQLNGAWTTSTRSAMKAFTDRVNATLPVTEPDYILLALVESHQDKVCGRACPNEQGLSNEGRCLPNAILAKKGVHAARIAEPHKAHQPVPSAPPITSWSTTTTAVTPLLPARPAPPEGRMALAGPAANLKPVGAPLATSRELRPNRAQRVSRKGYDRRFARPLRYVRWGHGWSRVLFSPGRSLF